MKILSIIMAFMILMLAVKPGLDALAILPSLQNTCCLEGVCVSADTTDVGGDLPIDHQDGPCKTCNPFHACCVCTMLCASPTALEIETLEPVSTKKLFSYQSPHSYLFMSDLWQPPRLA